MSVRPAQVLMHVRRLVGPSPGEQADAELLDRFVRLRDESAFAELVGRHGPMVLGVCRRVLADASAAEDAFQAVFLVLARKAGSLGRPSALAAWLYGTARRLALKARGRRARRREETLSADPGCPRPDVLD